MAANSVNGVLQFIRTLVAGHSDLEQPDHLLVDQFVAQRDERAFAALLERHGPMVLGVCRRLLHDEHLTEDAFQATFLVLARKAGELRKRESVAGYLHRVAMNMARKVRADLAKSRLRVPSPEAENKADAEAQSSWCEQQAILDQELQRLPEKYRVPLLLCYFEGRTRDEAALQLGWSTGKLRGLLDRGRELLRAKLIRRGVTLAAAGSATLLADTAISAAVPPLLAVSTVKASLGFAAGKTLAACKVSASVSALVEGSLMAAPSKALMASLLLLIGFIGAGARFWGAPYDAAPVAVGQHFETPSAAARPATPAVRADESSQADRTEASVSLPADGAMTFTITNSTKGKFADEQVYWAILGNGSHYLDLNGNLLPMSLDDNLAPGHLTKKGVNYANYFHTLAEASKIVVPKMNAGRLYLSLGSPMFFRVVANGYTGADVANPNDPNADIHFDFIEFNLDAAGFRGNTTQVDAFGFPLTMEVIDGGGRSARVGITQPRGALFAAFKNNLPKEFAGCLQEPYRIVAPWKADFRKGQANGNYFDGYIDEVWARYARPTKTPGGYIGEVVDGALVFTDGTGKSLKLARKPTTQEVLLGNGVLHAQPLFCAAIHRHVLGDPGDWSNQGKYYQSGPANYYARFWHEHSLAGKAFGFCRDDAHAQEALIEARRPTNLNVTISWD